MNPNLLALIVAGVLVVVAGFLVAAETAIGRVSRARADELTHQGVRGAARLRPLLDDRARYVNVLLFLHMALFVAATVLVTKAFLDVIGGPLWWQLLAAALVMIVVDYVVLGVAPRTLGVQHADRIAVRWAAPARFLAVLLSPLARLLILLGNALTPGKGYREGPFASQAELRELVDLAEASDVIEDDERQMIHSVFELGDTFARELMVPRTDMVFIEQNKPVASLMRPAFMVPASRRADELLRDMQAAHVHIAVLVDEYGGTAGIVTIEDVVEEIVGEISDEYDTEVPEVERLAQGAYRVHARMHVEDFADLIGVVLDGEEEGVDTVGGLLAKRLGRVPIPGARITVEGWDLTAESSAGRRNRIGTVLAEPIDSADISATREPGE